MAKRKFSRARSNKLKAAWACINATQLKIKRKRKRSLSKASKLYKQKLNRFQRHTRVMHFP